MSNWAFIAILVGLGIVWYVVSKSREGFQTEFLDRSNEEKTDQTRASSYAQDTNHFKPTYGAFEPPSGIATPYRVNMFDSYIPA